jgi:hypothetical protein
MSGSVSCGRWWWPALPVLLSLQLPMGASAAATVGMPPDVLYPYLYWGVLTVGPSISCPLLVTEKSGAFVLQDYGTFVAGDTVVVAASTLGECACGGADYTCVQNAIIGLWRNFDFGCGEIRADLATQCVYFTSPTYGVFTLSGPHIQPEHPEITVTGTLASCTAVTQCPADNCLIQAEILACPDPAAVTTWGQIKATYR